MTTLLKKLLKVTTLEDYQREQKKLQLESMQDFERVICVLSSCRLEEQVKIAENYFDVFKSKWNKINTEVMTYNTLIFNKEKERIVRELPKVEECVGLLPILV
jgi:hypothetical protein